jgi:YegS/Rv2252/BmrU family lipid kinase
MQDLFFFIVNSRIGEKRIAELTQAVQYTFGTNGYEILQTKYGGHAKDLTLQLVNEGAKNIVAVGGDGTVNEVIQVLAKKEIRLGIIPTGSGNGFARHCKIPLKMNEAVALLKNGKPAIIDLGKINDVYFISNAGVGFDAVVCNAIKQTKSRGLKMYVRKVIQHYFTYKADTYTIHIDGKEFKQKAFFMNVANGKEFGYGFEIAPEATLQDGMLDMIIVKKINPFNGFKFVLDGWRKKLIKNKNCMYQRGKKIRIEGEQLNYFQADGDAHDCNAFCEIEVHENALQIIVPSSLNSL